MDDCLVVGAGVIGLSLAYELSQRGLRVRVVDRGVVGREASWAGAGILPPANPETADHPWEKLRGISHQLHPVWAQRLREETGIDTGYRQCGGIYLARSAGEAASLVGLANLFDSLRIPIQRLTSEELVAREPALRPLAASGRLRSAYVLPTEAQLRNPRHLAALLSACRSRGVRVDENVAITGFARQGRRLASVLTTAGELPAGHFVLCAGAWTFELLQHFDVSTGILPIRGQMVLFRGESPPFRHVLNEGTRYLVARDDGRVLAGSTEEEAGFDKSTTSAGTNELTQFACELVPMLREFVVERCWAGLRPGSFDGFPYLGPIPGLDNAFVGAGHFRSGLHLSPGTAVVLSDLVCGVAPTIDLTPFQVGRG